MCGIVGFVTRKDEPGRLMDALRSMLSFDTIRGMDSTGVAMVNIKTGNADLIKNTMPGYVFANDEETVHGLTKEPYHVYIGHNRAATRGTVSADNAHPFWKEDRETGREIVLVHNGTIYNKNDLECGKNYDVDSEAICNHVLLHGIEDTVKIMDGSYALVWWDFPSKTLNFIRCDQRPMNIIYADKFESMIFSSQLDIASAAMRRDGVELASSFRPDPWKLYSFSLDDLKNPTITDLNGVARKVLPKSVRKYGQTYYPPALPSKKDTKGDTVASVSPESFKVAEAFDALKDKQVEVYVVEKQKVKDGFRYIGCMFESPFYDVSFYDRDGKFEENDLVMGTVSAAYWDSDLKTVRLIVRKAVLTDREEGEQSGTMPGPGGQKITEDTWNRLTKYGCSSCMQVFEKEDADDIVWIGDSPTCNDCACAMTHAAH